MTPSNPKRNDSSNHYMYSCVFLAGDLRLAHGVHPVPGVPAGAGPLPRLPRLRPPAGRPLPLPPLRRRRQRRVPRPPLGVDRQVRRRVSTYASTVGSEVQSNKKEPSIDDFREIMVSSHLRIHASPEVPH